MSFKDESEVARVIREQQETGTCSGSIFDNAKAGTVKPAIYKANNRQLTSNQPRTLKKRPPVRKF